MYAGVNVYRKLPAVRIQTDNYRESRQYITQHPFINNGRRLLKKKTAEVKDKPKTMTIVKCLIEFS